MKIKVGDMAKRVIIFFTFISLLIVVDLGARRKISTRKTYYHHSPCGKRGLSKRKRRTTLDKNEAITNCIKTIKNGMALIERSDEQSNQEKLLEPEPIPIDQGQDLKGLVDSLKELVVLATSEEKSEKVESLCVEKEDESCSDEAKEIELVKESEQEKESQYIKELSDEAEQEAINVESELFAASEQGLKTQNSTKDYDMGSQQSIPTVPYQQMPQNYQMQQMQVAVPMYQQQMPCMMQAPMYQQNPYLQNQNQMAATAMQLQASAMAMQAQASALMMQAQQQPIYVQVPVAQQMGRDLTQQEKADQCMYYLRQVVGMGEGAVQRLLLLLDLEFDILEHLLAGNVGKHVENAVQERNRCIKTCLPQVVTAYDTILDVSTTYGNDDTGSRLYHYCVRKSKDTKQTSPSRSRKKFLMKVMYELEKYYSMLEKMQRTLSP